MLEICRHFFEYLELNSIRYCHWKSNEHLEEALSGKTDLDLLIHEEDREEFESALKNFSIKEILSPPAKRFPGIYDYLGFDEYSGTLVHLHVHYRLILGQKFIKNHHLPIERVIFQNLIQIDGIYIPCPEIELILLFIRAHMKTDPVSVIKSGIKNILGRHSSPFPLSIEKEFTGLIGKVSYGKLFDVLTATRLPLHKKIFEKFISDFSKNNLYFYYTYYLKIYILFSLRNFRRYSGMRLGFKQIYFILTNSPVIKRLLGPSKKTLTTRGRTFSLVGADGSGKSTLINDLNRWLSWKLIVNEYYYGIPKSSSVKAVSYIVRGFHKIKLRFLASLLEKYLNIFIARKRYKINLSSQDDVKRGEIVITDRFPLNEFQSMPEPMDGPRLQRDGMKASYLSKLENSYYEKLAMPDQVFVLRASIEELRKRKTDLDIVTHRIKAEAVNNLPASKLHTLINADMPYSEVLLEIKKKIWILI
jgi:thymidylate kinase